MPQIPCTSSLKPAKVFWFCQNYKNGWLQFLSLLYLKYVGEKWVIIIGHFPHTAFSIKMTTKHSILCIFLKNELLHSFFLFPSFPSSLLPSLPSSLPPFLPPACLPSFSPFLPFLKCKLALTQFVRKWCVTLTDTVWTLISLACWYQNFEPIIGQISYYS